MKKRFIIITLLVSISFCLVSCNKLFPDKCKNGKHEKTEWRIDVDSTCSTLGSKSLVCKNCGEVISTASIDYKNHTIVEDKEILPTCIESGLTKGSHCFVCKTIIEKQTEVNALGHNYILVESNDLVLIYECSNCHDTYEKENNGNSCDYGKHESSDWITVKEATCKETGLSHKVCTKCGIELEVKTLPLASHKEVEVKGKDASCTESGLTDGVKCSFCEKVIVEQTIIKALGHNYKITSTKSPTQDEAGYVEYTCSRCGNSYQTTLSASVDYNSEEPTLIILNNEQITIGNNNGGVIVNNNQVVISLAGEYDLIGEASNASIKVVLFDTEKATINLRGVNLTSTDDNPIFIESGDSVDICAKADTINYIYDKRSITSDAIGGGIYSKIDLDIKGKGTLYVTSAYNNGIATTKDLKIKNLTLEVNAVNNALKGNDSVTIESGTIKAISSSGDAIKTEDSDVSSKGNQRGIVKIIDGTIDLYAGCDGIDSSYDVIIEGGTINIYTEKYSSYTGDVELSNSSTLYIRLSNRANQLSSITKYSAQFIFEDGSSTWVNGSSLNSGMYKYYSFKAPSNAKYVKVYAYNSSQTQGQNQNYAYATDQLSINSSYDTLYISSVSNTKMNYSWENYNSQSFGGGRPGGMSGPGGMGGGFNDGNSNKATYSCKGIKADNSITINGGNIIIKSHDDAIHTNSDVVLESGSYGSADLIINGGSLNLYSDDDAIHSDGTVKINGGDIVITNSYEGVEGEYIYFIGGKTQIKSKDDAINSKTTLYIQGGFIYLDADGDGIDSNGSVYMSGGIVLALGPTNGGNGVLDIGDRNAKFSFSGGLLLAIGCSGMDVKPTGTTGNTVSASRTTAPSVNSYLTISSNGEVVAVLKVTKNNQNYRVLAYNNTDYPSTSVASSTSTSYSLTNGLYYVVEK